ncbi:hypothetical protein Pmar_PMAR001219 [Perkinsus marinus ATCC 50983]|uniref:Uncharacterized protein n=1 Tax=Perkinsus marinus (strain ATCC 50983 / TXsc) TaxID=423536 RepID=C5KT71_PERM5|nr:hypothetical protein Pmar_PMAR001219 [Perkinsus marinus ATCC 50983]EER12421.1 hypothetical protein Pmar_PMAR001219 [Perkinsus marinus ATCC 50983]|eukprot:XP_002780626.1 hypothetical protein Pmar_PMAR001219 [Perkinsus marinus ATCC 50983]
MAAGTQQACGESGYSVGLNSPTVDVKRAHVIAEKREAVVSNAGGVSTADLLSDDAGEEDDERVVDV